MSLHAEHDALAELPADVAAGWPACEAAHLPLVVASMLHEWNYVDDARLRILMHRACDPTPRARFRSLGELDEALGQLARGKAVRYGDELAAWRAFDEGAGWLELGQFAQALQCFEEALDHDPDIGQALEGVELATEMLRQAQRPLVKASDSFPQLEVVQPTGSRFKRVLGMLWVHAEPAGLALEQQRDFGRALDVYRAVGLDARTNLALFIAQARCHLALSDVGAAIDYAQRALALDNTNIAALEHLVAAMLARRWHEEALRNAEQLCDLAPASARAHYLRGKALFANGRMPEARDAFQRASEVDPKLLEAQLLRREVERVTGNVNKSVGSQHGPAFDIPEQLAELRDVLIGGDTQASIAALADARYAADADAQLLLARLLLFDRRFEAAFDVYDRLVATSHRAAALVGKATALLELGKPGDALDIFAQLPDDADAAEGAARALEMLGRVDEAAAAYRRFIALASSGSELRVRAAELWLASR